MAKKAKKYAFVDLAIDVFYSIILYNTFVAFPGFKLELGLMAIAVFVMINYWWGSRSYFQLPKHYLVDFYFITLTMFIFSQWSNYFTNVTNFLYVLVIFFMVQAIFSLADIYSHKEKKDEPSLKYYIVVDSLLAIVYLTEAFFIKTLTPLALIIIFIPYLLFLISNIRKKLFRFEFTSITG